MPEARSQVFALADRYVEAWAALDPLAATARGVAGHDTEVTDLSPRGIEAREELTRQTLHQLRRLPIESDADRLAAGVLAERLDAQLALDDAGEPYRPLRVIGSPLQSVRQAFDLMARSSADDWVAIADRMERVPHALTGFRHTLDEALRRGLHAARRQATACAEQAATWAGLRGAPAYFVALADTFAGTGIDDPALGPRLAEAAAAATEAVEVTARFLFDDYAPRAPDDDAVGPERYDRFARFSLGASPDLQETYEWGWAELARIEAELADLADRIVPGGSTAEARAHLDTDPAQAVEGVDAFRRWLQDLMDRTVDELDGTHFDIPGPIRRVEAMIAPPGGAAAMYYTPPSEDLTRPGRTWYPTLGKTRFPLWPEVTTAFHEGVPGHHLQIGQVRVLGDRLSRFQRLTFVSGHGEGWALYAERLMDELGFLADPGTRFGFLTSQQFRAARVVIDIGVHLGMRLPAGQPFHPGERWTPALALAFLRPRSPFGDAFAASEIDRYLGWPAQAISYKVGERAWLECRHDVAARLGPAFDLRAFHAGALGLGNLGLDLLRAELGRLGAVPPEPAP
ncbi:MAG: DUF885 domain-containing protein [Acidimicrobiales bacterium]|nr:DUF885 domain-containing protein [Acidimicrobiales bacterium]